MQSYLFDMKNMEQLCDTFEEAILNRFFEESESEAPSYKHYSYTPIFQQRFNPIEHVIDVSSLFGIETIEINKEFLKGKVYVLGNSLPARDIFRQYVSDIKSVFRDAKEEIKHLYLMFDETEMNRINEAIHNFLEGCYYSSVAMSVCAIESRLLKLMSNVKREELERLEKMTLGQLIREYSDNKGRYNNLIPKKHEPLLDLCNIYRIFSVHPKKEEITKGVASAILNLSIVFLTDEETQVAQEITEV